MYLVNTNWKSKIRAYLLWRTAFLILIIKICCIFFQLCEMFFQVWSELDQLLFLFWRVLFQILTVVHCTDLLFRIVQLCGLFFQVWWELDRLLGGLERSERVFNNRAKEGSRISQTVESAAAIFDQERFRGSNMNLRIIYVTGGKFKSNGTTSVPKSVPRLVSDYCSSHLRCFDPDLDGIRTHRGRRTGCYQLPIFHCTNVHPWRCACLLMTSWAITCSQHLPWKMNF